MDRSPRARENEKRCLLPPGQIPKSHKVAWSRGRICTVVSSGICRSCRSALEDPAADPAQLLVRARIAGDTVNTITARLPVGQSSWCRCRNSLSFAPDLCMEVRSVFNDLISM
jgi:hypothetical protein